MVQGFFSFLKHIFKYILRPGVKSLYSSLKICRYIGFQDKAGTSAHIRLKSMNGGHVQKKE